MSNSTWVTFKGIGKWVKNRNPDPIYHNYTVDLYMDEENLNLLKEVGAQLVPKSDDEGTYVRFRRPTQKLIKDELVKFGPPKTTDADGNDLNELIGNGSELEVTCVFYNTSIKGVGHRLERIKVLKLVPYTKPSGQSDLPISKGSNLGIATNTIPF